MEHNSVEAPTVSLVSPGYFLLNRCHKTLPLFKPEETSRETHRATREREKQRGQRGRDSVK